ncbi:unnamed protein product, partial [Prorocentrum cordatum]
ERQASRGLARAGLGLRRLEAHAAGAYLASLGATRRLCSELLPQSASARPDAVDTARQKDLSAALGDHCHQLFFENLGAADRAVAPNEKLGLLFEPEEFLTELRRRLLLQVYDTGYFCPCCDVPRDRHGRHAGLCAGVGDRVCPRNAARNLVGRFAAAAGCNPELERPELLPPRPDDDRAFGRRPADVHIPSWHRGTPAAYDFA